MISITQRPSIKAIGKTSLFVSFEYNAKIVELVKSAENAIYHKDTHEWELPLSKLSYLVDSLTYVDDIDINLMPAPKKEGLSTVLTHEIAPFDYQQEGIEWLINTNSGLLLDPPGLGKTLQIIYAAEELYEQKKIDHCLIICGINTLKQNWKKEIEKFSSLSCRIIGEKISSKGKISYASVKERAEELYNYIEDFFLIINVESLRDSLVIDAIINSENTFDMIVVDEVHKCKSPTSQQGKNLLKLAKVGKYHYGLTGTLLVNNPLDAYSPLKFIGQEKATYSNFKAYYCKLGGKFSDYQVVGYQNLDNLKEEIADCSLRRSKDLLNLPPKVIIPEYIEMDLSQEKFYNDLKEGIVAEADRVNIKTSSLLGLVTRLRQAATCPSVLSTSDIVNSKLERCCDLVEEITSNNEKVIVFSTFKEPLYQLKDLLAEYNPVLCTGDQEEMEISSSIDSFQNNPDIKVILCTTSKMGTGITLTAASYEIFLDSNWTYSLEEQCEDRAYRIGTSKSVIIYKLVARNTIDERIKQLIELKRGMSDYMIDDDPNQTDELKYLLGLKTSVY